VSARGRHGTARVPVALLGAVAAVAVGVGVAAMVTGAARTPTVPVAATPAGPAAVPSRSGPAGSPSPAASPAGPGPSAGFEGSDGDEGEGVPGSFPHSGPGSFRDVGTTGPVLGGAGRLHRFALVLESNLGMVDPAVVAATVDRVLGDPRSWIADATVRFQRVPATAGPEFTIHLATAATTRRMCEAGGVSGTGGYTSCRYGGHVVINLDRWYLAVPWYRTAGTGLAVYRVYVINHEVGHQLGHGHERCPAPGAVAPVMQQQTLGLHGCTANPWPFVAGRAYHGPAGHY